MLARSRPLHLTQPALRGPLLIPAVSSKGFPIVDGLSEVGKVLQLVSQSINEALLVSAYDLHHGLLPDHDRLFGPEHAQTLYATPALLVVDSGGYELLDTFESGEIWRGPQEKRPFDRADFEALVDRLPEDKDQLVVTYDEPDLERPGYRQQREAAQQFAVARPHLHINFLLKPPAGDRFVDPAKLTPDAGDLRGFATIGVTEKELGDKVLDRLVCLAQLRKLLNDSGAETVPIHVFGALDPLLTPLYFMAGGEIFDGLSWLRYAYHEGTALHPDELAVLTGSIEAREALRDAQRHFSNLQQLASLKLALERWAHDQEQYELLGPRHERFREIHQSLRARLERRE